MPRDIRDFIMRLRLSESLHPRQFEDVVEELAARIRHGDIIIRDNVEIDELVHTLGLWLQRGKIPPHYLDRAIHGLYASIEESPLLPTSLSMRLRSSLLREFDRLSHPAALEEERKRETRQKEKQEEQEKVLQSIKNIKLAESDRVLFFVGAGASKPSPSNIPTVNELLPKLWEKSIRMKTKPLEKLQTWCAENNIENIEEMLTAVTISNFIIKSPKVHGLLNSVLYPEWKKETSIRDIDAVLHLESMLDTFFSLLVGTMLQAKPNLIHKSIAGYVKAQRNVDILTTNYDACLDQALDELEVDYNYGFSTLAGSNTLHLIKMHGSINWFYCDSCQSVFLPPIETVAAAIEKDIPYAVTGMCRHCNAQVKQFIIPPVAHKYLTHPPIVQVWECGRKVLEQAKFFVVVGYSFADADDYIAKMLVKAVGQNPETKVIVVDIDNNVIDRCKSFIKSHVDAFDEKTSFFPLQGDGLDLVPKVIKSLTEAKSGKEFREKKTATPSKSTQQMKNNLHRE